MHRLYFTLSILILASLLAGCAPGANAQAEQVKASENFAPTDLPAKSEVVPHDLPASCPLTVPQDPRFIPPSPYSPNGPFVEWFWHGSNSLWTAIPQNGIWSGLPYDSHGYTQKIFWWSDLFSRKDEPEPALVVTGERLDAGAPPLQVSRATNASAGDIGTAMLVGVDFPTLGCWKITGQYKKTKLSFVAWLAP